MRRPFFSSFVVLLVLGPFALAGLGACGGEEPLPDPGSDTYREAVTAFYTGLAAIQAGENRGAEAELLRVTELVPQEPAAWANLGLLSLRRNEPEAAAERLQRAAALAPDNSHIQVLLGLLASQQGRFEEAIESLRRAFTLDPQNLKAGYALAREIERQGADGSDDRVQALLDTLLQLRPDNLALLLDHTRLAAKRGDAATLRSSVARIREQAGGWPAEVQDQLDALRQAAETDARQAATQVAFLRNLLLRVPDYREDLAAVQIPPEEVGELMTRFVRMPSPSPHPAPADTGLTFTMDPLQTGGGGPWAWAGAFWLGTDATPALTAANAQEVRFLDGPSVAFPGTGTPPSPFGVTGVDYDYDFRADLAAAGAGGFRLYRQDSTGTFVDATAGTGLPAGVTGAAYYGAWAADLDMEGDIDLVLARASGAPVTLRNNGDGTFTERTFFPGLDGLRRFAWGDLDADGDPDAAVVDAAGRLRVFANDRSGRFAERPVPGGPAVGVAVTDLDADGALDLAVLRAGGALERLTDVHETEWQTTALAQWEGMPGGEALLHAVDLDNNGALDLLATTPQGSRVWLGTPDRTFRALEATIAGLILSFADVTGNGRLDLVGVANGGQPALFINQGLQSYHWKTLQLRAAATQGDQRINSFGIGGEVEVRSGLLFQKQPITAPVVHFGLGEQTNVDVARIVWPNGNVQAEFDLASDQTVMANQRLKGSCPWLFTHDGTRMQFVTDFLWRSPLGLKINAQETAGVASTEDWVKIRGDQLAPRDGYYDVRITAELWETHFFDLVELLVVDHPAGTEVYVDERFIMPPPPHQVQAVTPPVPVAAAWDHTGRDVTDVVRATDQRYLDVGALGPYQGVAQDHYVEVALGDEAPAVGPLVLVARGWVRPTDSSLNVALAQGSHAPPTSLSLEVPDGRGGWTTARGNLGFPSGKEKTILLDLTDVFLPGTERRVRLRTNLEVYWDALAWAVPQPGADVRTTRLSAATADLRYRGFSAVTEADRTSPEIPHYDDLRGTHPYWRDLVGYHTRFGDVRELIEKVEDRYVIMNAGDELALRFAAPPPPPDGWVRDFVLVGDGWEKDGDYNTTFSKTVLPLPSHDNPAYATPPTRLEDDPVYQRYPDDWRTYHTRYVTDERFQRALRLE